MNSLEKKMIKEYINDIKGLNIEEKLLMFKYYLEAYIKSIITFGISHKVTVDTKMMWNNYLIIMDEEQKIFRFMEYDETAKYISLLDDTNSLTVKYYYNVFDDILDACDTSDSFRAEHSKKEFNTLIDTDEYRQEVVGLTIKLEDIMKFLDYPQEYWNYVNENVEIKKINDLSTALLTLKQLSDLYHEQNSTNIDKNVEEEFKKEYVLSKFK